MKKKEERFRKEFQELLKKYNAEFELENYWQSKANIIIDADSEEKETIIFDLSE